jgi:hypothetical protein
MDIGSVTIRPSDDIQSNVKISSEGIFEDVYFTDQSVSSDNIENVNWTQVLEENKKVAAFNIKFDLKSLLDEQQMFMEFTNQNNRSKESDFTISPESFEVTSYDLDGNELVESPIQTQIESGVLALKGERGFSFKRTWQTDLFLGAKPSLGSAGINQIIAFKIPEERIGANLKCNDESYPISVDF